MTENLEPPTTQPSSTDLSDQLRRRLDREKRAAASRLADRPPPFILASASPRRRELLQDLQLRFDVMPADIPEVPQAGETPQRFAARAAQEKATHIASRYPDQWVLAADTVVTLGGAILGKPQDRDHAYRMLEALSGVAHRVCSAIALAARGRPPDVIVVESEVVFKPLAAADIDAYVDTGEPFDKAGAYGIQGHAVRFVTSLSGSYSNVIGLPLEEVADLLSRTRRRA